MTRINDTWFRILVIIVTFVEGLWANNLFIRPIDTRWISEAMVSIITITLVCEGNRYIIYRSRSLFGMSRPWRRMTACITAGVLYTTLLILLNMVAYHIVRTGQWDLNIRAASNIYVNNVQVNVGLWPIAIIKALFAFFLLLPVYETFYYFARLRYTEKERERLEKEKLKAELQQLKGIVNPHFLFNNLNSLSALISENPVQAEVFLDELTKVFRYLLKNNDSELTPLSQEIKFIQSYYNLLQTRYGGAINLNMSIAPAVEELMIPPLTLQLLVENAVKHNRVQIENPLLIEVYTIEGNKLVVRNNVCRKEGRIDSTGIGLQNIKARYKMLNLPALEIERDETCFSVILPLAASGIHDQKPIPVQPVLAV